MFCSSVKSQDKTITIETADKLRDWHNFTGSTNDSGFVTSQFETPLFQIKHHLNAFIDKGVILGRADRIS